MNELKYLGTLGVRQYDTQAVFFPAWEIPARVQGSPMLLKP
jgi:hypothetical protein